MGRTLYRSRSDRMLGGVAAGLAEYFGQDPTLIRLAIVVLSVVTSGTVILAYLVLWVVVPEAPEADGGATSSLVDEWFGAKDEAKAAAPAPETPAADPEATADPMVGVGPPASSATTGSTTSGTRGGWWVGVVLVVFGLLMLAERFLPRLDVWELWPLALIGIGLFMVFSRKDD